MKSDCTYLLGLYRSILADITDTYPHLQKDFGRDFSRLSSCTEARGLSFLMIDLVAFGKHFDVCLSKERLTPSGLTAMRPFRKGVVVPRLFRGLLLRVFSATGELRVDFDVNAIRCLRQLYYAAKKYRMECSHAAKREVLNSFYKVESGIRHNSHTWDYDDPHWPDSSSLVLYREPAGHQGRQGDLFPLDEPSPQLKECLHVIQDTFDIIASTVGNYRPELWSAQHGPGAVSDLSYGVDPQLLQLRPNDRTESGFLSSKYRFPTWSDKLSSSYPIDAFAFANADAWIRWLEDLPEKNDRLVSVEHPSRLILVPKTLKAPRLIASEPTSHQWCQQSIRAFLVSRTSQTLIGRFIAFRDQVPNQVMAMRGSQTGKLATIDLSEASDRLSTWLVERAFRRNESLLFALHATRTRWIHNTIDSKFPEFHFLRKFACMGSACTFPVQSLVFLGIALGSTLYARGLKVSYRNLGKLAGEVRVFGDDIIVPTDAVEHSLAALEYLGLKVNREKTFSTGMFRESCGIDAFAGAKVTPVYTMTKPVKSRPESVIGSVATHNNFLLEGWVKTAKFIESAVRSEASKLPYVEAGSDSFGLQTYGYPDNSHLEVRGNRYLHRPERKQLLPYSKSVKRRDRGDSMMLQYFTERPRPDDNWVGGVSSRTQVFLRLGWVGI